jgi:hypothetical protein
MFLTFTTKDIRFNWLRRKYHAKYGNWSILAIYVFAIISYLNFYVLEMM